jgi:multidrug efflux pump subunit AcrA (membrane-fusion protein)
LSPVSLLAEWLLGGSDHISGAVIAPGVLVVDSYVKKVQHPVGIVGEIPARNGDRVKAGDVVRLDATITAPTWQSSRKD